jgi:DNA invertase Pin-like site-specific DNA recombinase
MNSSDLIQPSHRQRQALIYIRQSTPGQVHNHAESLRLQYALRELALEYGWPAEAVEVIDSDLGRTGRTTEGRPGFLKMVQQVSLGHVGIIFAFDVTRFARNCSDWYQLLDLCGYRSCLVGDQDSTYDPATVNGRLILGLKGLISELELHTIRSRLSAGLLNKARRGELALRLPVGLVRDELGRVVKHPNREVQDRLELIFSTFQRLRSIRRVVQYFHDNDLNIPRCDTWGDIVWKPSSVSAIGSTLSNPAYAGCFVYGRTRVRTGPTPGQPEGIQRLPLDQWKIRIPDCYPAYISWDTYVTIQDMIRDNYNAYRERGTRGVARDGKALLQGIVYCVICGRQMMVHYGSGTHYVCHSIKDQYQTPACQRMSSESIDRAAVAAFWTVLQPAQLDLWEKAQANIAAEQTEWRRNHEQQLERLRYQAKLAQRQYERTDPDNRLVAAELEKRWEESLRQLKQAEDKVASSTDRRGEASVITDEIRRLWKQAGDQLPDLWRQGRLSHAQQKALLRCLIDKVVLERTPAATCKIRIVWKGGESTREEVPVTVAGRKQLPFSKEMEKAVVRYARQGKTDDWIACEMNRLGYRSALRPFVPLSLIRIIRREHKIPMAQQRGTRTIPGCYTPRQIARRIKMPVSWIEVRILDGTIHLELDETWQMFLFPSTPETLKEFRKLRDGKVTQLWFKGGASR